MQTDHAETIVIGGGVVGLSVAVGLLRAGVRVAVVDGADGDHRASHGNFGLVWVQGKGAGFAPYAHWTRDASDLWPGFAADVRDATGIDVALCQDGGYELFTDEAEYTAFQGDLAKQKRILGDRFEYECRSGAEMRKRYSAVGPALVGATFTPHCGHVNPLRLLHALRLMFQRLGGTLESHFNVADIVAGGSGFTLTSGGSRKMTCERVVLCAGLGAADLAGKLGFTTIVRAQRGQLLITEKCTADLPFLSSTIRQVGEGGIQIGGTKENVGLDDSETLSVTAGLAQHAVDVFPVLAGVRVVRSWGALRVLSPDGYPVYARSSQHENAFLVTCHSGVTLASAHAVELPKWLLGAADAPDLEAFDEIRFAA